ncbi:uncharacterized membrane protein YsdA (DUF1294 family) [Virgibacillus halotolerans]|uniref:DUF1294 domain-containing protein n=1 Tax=Virgibacillus halotolerans TaxID=1071053 RepID=UPI00195FEEED|nr:DUF1294 domain-containing protein [Virgibacillus halotolerans]MBM7597744.1 uncharacterized membrane protein YsdA (DUF1294 family) [Virgibacillus halotolerans]
MNELNTILTYVAGANIITFILMGVDKQKAIKHQYRIPERTFWLLSLIGGAFGSLIGMNVFRHKTKHRSFVIGMPILLIFNCIVVSYFFMS